MRVHNRKDFEFFIIKGRAYFSRAAYACVITQNTAYPDQRAIHHIETFYGDSGVKARAEARRYGRAIVTGKRGVGGFREQYLSHNFPPPADMPLAEKHIVIR